MAHIHPVFHVSLLKPYHAGGSLEGLPDLVVRKDEVEYELEAIKGHRRRWNWLEYLVSWKGYDSSEDMYLVEADLENCADLLTEYKQTVRLT